MPNCDPNKQPSGHGRPLSLVDEMVLALDGSQCVNCKGGKLVTDPTTEDATSVHSRCVRCGIEFDTEVQG